MRIQGGLYGHFNLLRTRLVIYCQHMTVVVGHDHLAGVAGADFLSADDQRYVELDTALSFKFCFEGYSLRRAFQIGLYRFIGRQKEIENHEYTASAAHFKVLKIKYKKQGTLLSSKTIQLKGRLSSTRPQRQLKHTSVGVTFPKLYINTQSFFD